MLEKKGQKGGVTNTGVDSQNKGIQKPLSTMFLTVDTTRIFYYFTTFEEYKVIYPKRSSDYMPKDYFDSNQVILSIVNLQKK